MTVRLLTEEQAFAIGGELLAPDSYFSPVKDADGNYIISEEEVENTTAEQFLWVKGLPSIEYKPYIKPNLMDLS